MHHELGTAAPDVADLLCGQLQVPADKVILGHLNRLPDPYLQRQTAQTGAFLAAELGDAVAEKFFVRNPARAYCRNVRGARPVTSATSGQGRDSSSVPVT